MPLARFAAAQGGAPATSRWPSGARPGADIAELPRWRALAAFLLTQEDTVRKTVTVNNGFPAGKEFKAQKDAMLAALAALTKLQVAALVRLRQLPLPDHDMTTPSCAPWRG
jgi:ATP-dependent helicase/nuclease subunit A